MTINQVQCDGCGKAADRIKKEATVLSDYHASPEDWNWFSGKDLCPDCTKKVEEFIQGLKV
jgi:endogenous inhibitor of DNA gyrase (YacG/DUF329 family)